MTVIQTNDVWACRSDKTRRINFINFSIPRYIITFTFKTVKLDCFVTLEPVPTQILDLQKINYKHTTH